MRAKYELFPAVIQVTTYVCVKLLEYITVAIPVNKDPAGECSLIKSALLFYRR